MSVFNWRILVCICITAAWGLQVACDEPRHLDGDDDNDDNGGDSDADSDADTGTGECTPVPWGSGFAVGSPVANWFQSGYIDGDGDGVIEETEVDFDLEQIHCQGVESIVLMIGDTS